MANRARASFVACALALLALARGTDAQTAWSDPAGRGLDAFIHVVDRAPPGALLPLQVEAIGFPTVVSFVPLGGAIIEATWNPEKLGATLGVPPAVKVTADAYGRAHLEVPMPEGDEGPLELL